MDVAVLCDQLQQILDITGPKLVFEILAGAKTRIEAQYTKRIELGCHFNTPALTMENYIDIIKEHMVIRSSQIRENRVETLYACNACNFSSPSIERFQEHINHGPFSESHSLGSIAKQDSEIVLYMILAFFRIDENDSIVCNKCDIGFSSIKVDKLYTHCIGHGSEVPEMELNATEIKEEIKKLAKVGQKSLVKAERLHPCIPCTSLFPNLTELYTHANIQIHDPKIVNFCSICVKETFGNIFDHLKEHHRLEIGEHFLPEWDVKLDHNLNVILDNAKEFSEFERREGGSSSMEKNILEKTSLTHPPLDFGDIAYLRGAEFFDKQDLCQIFWHISSVPFQEGKIQYPNNISSLEMRQLLDIIPNPAPLSMKFVIVEQFPGLLNAFILEPGYKMLRNVDELIDINVNNVTLRNVFVPNRRTYPIILFGGPILESVVITDEGRNVSYNASPGKDLFWSTESMCGVETLEGQNNEFFDFSFFKALEKELFGLDEYEGLVMIEANIQKVLKEHENNETLVYNLARSFFYKLLNMKVIPKNMVVVGCVNSNPNTLKLFGPAIAMYNAYLKQLCFKWNIVFLDPNCMGIKTMLNADNIWTYHTPTGYHYQRRMFDPTGRLTLNGHFIYTEWLQSFYSMARRIATQLSLQLKETIF